MKTALTASAVFLTVAYGCLAQTTNTESVTVDQLAKLTNGMLLTEFQTVLGIQGRTRENALRIEAIVDFDFNGEWIMAEVQTHPSPSIVKSFRIIKDGLTIQERQSVRSKNWNEWVAAHQRKTNGVPNQPSDPARKLADPQR